MAEDKGFYEELFAFRLEVDVFTGLPKGCIQSFSSVSVSKSRLMQPPCCATSMTTSACATANFFRSRRVLRRRIIAE